MLRTVILKSLVAALVLSLLTTPVLAFISHHHVVSAGNGFHEIQSQRCDVDDSKTELHDAGTCLLCLRAGSFYATPIERLNITMIDAVDSGEFPSVSELVDNLNPASPKRGPPIDLI